MIEEIEPGYYSAETFDELIPLCEQYFKENKIETIYKLRNWNEKYHPEVLTKGELYFSKPSDLNDPFDIHRPVQFDVSIINEKWFFNKLVEIAQNEGTFNIDHARIRASNKLDEIKADPNAYFLKNYEDMVNSDWFNDSIGVLSLSTNPLDDQLWGYYGGGLKGFAVGFDPMALTIDLQLNGWLVKYDDTINSAGLIGGTMKEHLDLYFQKNTRWSFESEFRYSNMVDKENQRKRYFSPGSLKEVILGPRISIEHKREILSVVKQKYYHAKVYQLKCDYLTGRMLKVEV